MGREAALGFDVGSTTVKAGLLWLDSHEPMLTVSRPYPTMRPRPGWVEQDPADWILGMSACWAELRTAAPEIELRAVGLCSQVNTHVFVDAGLAPLRAAICWQDTRAAAEALTLNQRVDARRTELWGGPFTIDASSALARLEWIAGHEPEVRVATRWLLQPRDWCIARLTGDISTDPLSPVGLVGSDDAYLTDVLALVDGARDVVPPLRAFDAPAGTTLAGNPVGLPADVPVAVSTMDAWGSIIGSGLMRPGRAMDVAGTSEIVAVSGERMVPTEGVVSFPDVRGTRIHAGPTQAGGLALEWVANLVSRSVPEALDVAAEAARRPQPIVFLPHLAGERAPYWDPAARGVFLGLTTDTESRDLVLAVLEGVAMSVRMLLALCEQAAAVEAPALRVCGGGARSELWNQLKATATGRPVEVLATLDAGVLGAALLGLVAAGAAGDVKAVADEHVRVAATIDPVEHQRARMDDLFGVYTDAYRALEPLFARLRNAR